jgi:hypothetical protein
MQELQEDLAALCEVARRNFKTKAVITLLIRTPALLDGDVIVTEDSFDEIAAALERLKAKAGEKGGGNG